MPFAGFWRRVAAYLVDALLIGLIGGSAFALLGLDGAASPMEPENLIGFAASWAYFALLESSRLQGTIGKYVVGLRVTDYDGGRIGLGRATVRYFGRLISSFLLGIGFLMVAFTERKQGLHDFLAGTYVMKGRPAAALAVAGDLPPRVA